MNDTAPDTTYDFSRRWINLASARLGAAAVSCSDDFFAPMERMLQDTAPQFIPDKYDDHGKWMDGWESRRKRTPGHDWCVVKLARPGLIRALEIDTTHFTGNYPPEAAVDVCFFEGDEPPANTQWQPLLARTGLCGDHNHQYPIARRGADATEAAAVAAATHLRVSMFPDGGIARLRVFGVPRVDWDGLPADERIDLAAALNGGVALYANDEHFGTAANMLLPGRGINMGDGWETRRRREPGHDWAVIALAHPGVVRQVVVDTAHFKGNYPHRCSIQGAHAPHFDAAAAALAEQSDEWPSLLPPRKLQADSEHHFEKEVVDIGAITHVRLNIHPDGGVSRLRLLGSIEAEAERGGRQRP